jgi:hypothetical protein
MPVQKAQDVYTLKRRQKMTLSEYKQALYDACTIHSKAATVYFDDYASAKTEEERQYAKIENRKHLAAYFVLQWALDMTSLLEVQNDNSKSN